MFENDRERKEKSEYFKRSVVNVWVTIGIAVVAASLLILSLFIMEKWMIYTAIGLVVLIGVIVLILHRVFLLPVLSATDLNEDEEEKKKRSRFEIGRRIDALVEQSQKNFAYEMSLELVQKQAEFNELQNQINPHFLYNTLESIRAEAMAEDASQVANMIKSLSSFYRYSIGRYHTLVTFREELENIENYFKIQRYRFGDRFSFNISILPEDEHCLELYIIKLSIQPIIENAIYHGLEVKPENGMVRISVDITESRLIITVSDNGIGIPPERLSQINELLNRNPDDLSVKNLETAKGTGTGLLNINKRIKMYFGNEYGLIVRSVMGVGTDIEIVLPIVTEISQ